jgi:hypothetical protein
MAIPSYTSGYPPDGSSLGQTKTTIRNNLDGTFQAFSIDHNNQNETGPGSHAQVQIKLTPSYPSIPAGLYGAGYETLYTQQVVNGELFFVRGADAAGARLTGPNYPNPGVNGYTFIPGGMMVNWGFVSASGNTSGTVTFTNAFINNRFGVYTTLTYASTAPTSPSPQWVSVGTTASPLTGFAWNLISSSSAITGFYWFAIGN